MAGLHLTPVQTVSEVGEIDIENGCAIINLGSYGAPLRLALDAHGIAMLATRAGSATRDLFAQQQDGGADVLAFPGRATR